MIYLVSLKAIVRVKKYAKKFFSLSNLEPNFIISSAFIDLGFPALNSALLNEVPDSFLHEFHRLEIHPTYVMLNLSYDL